MNTAIILGNGPSRTLIDQLPRNEFTAIFGCNFPHIKTSCIVINDATAMRKFAEEKKELEIPLILSYRAHQQYKKEKIAASVMSTYKQRPWFSSGHQAALKAIEFGHNELILCGFDVLFEDSIYSRTDDIFPKKNKNSKDRNCIREWRNAWEKIAKKEGIAVKAIIPENKKIVVPGIEPF